MSIAGALVFISLGLGGAVAEHLHRSRAGDADGPDQQARHPDRRGRERGAARRPLQAGGDRSTPPAIRLRPILMTTAAMVLGVVPLIIASRRRRGVALQHGPGDRQRPVDRHAVHPVRAAGGLYGHRRPPHRGTRGGAQSRASIKAGASVRAGPARPRPAGHGWLLAASSSFCFTCGSFCATRITLEYSCTDSPCDWIACTASALACSLMLCFCSGEAASHLP